MEYFSYAQGLTMTNQAFARLFGGPPRDPESKLTQREMDLARSVQDVMRRCRCCGWHATSIARRASGISAWQAAWRSIASVTGASFARDRSSRSGSSRRPATPAERSGAALSAWYQYLDNPRDVADGRSLRLGRDARVVSGSAVYRRSDRDLSEERGREVPQARAGVRSARSGAPPRGRARRRLVQSAGWSSGRARSAPAASSATRGRPGCSR